MYPQSNNNSSPYGQRPSMPYYEEDPNEKKSNSAVFYFAIIILALLLLGLGLYFGLDYIKKKSDEELAKQKAELQKQKNEVDLIQNGGVNDKSITKAKLADDVFVVAELKDGSITTAKIKNADVRLGDLNTDSLLEYFDKTLSDIELKNGSITNWHLADGSVTTAKIIDGAVTTAKLANGAITTIKIVDGAVSSGKIADGTVTGVDIANGAVTTIKIVDGAVTEAKLADGAITNTKFADLSITAIKIATGTITGEVVEDGVLVEGLTGRNAIQVINNHDGTFKAQIKKTCPNKSTLRWNTSLNDWECVVAEVNINDAPFLTQDPSTGLLNEVPVGTLTTNLTIQGNDTATRVITLGDSSDVVNINGLWRLQGTDIIASPQEINYLDGVRSPIQPQLDAKQDKITWGDGLQELSGVVRVRVSDIAGAGLGDDGANNLRIIDGGVTNIMLAGGITDDKLNQITTPNKVAGSAIQLGTNPGLQNNNGLQVKLADSSLTLTSAGLSVTDIFLRNDSDDTTTGTLTIKDLVASGLTSATPVEGKIYFNSSTGKLYLYNGSTWVDLTQLDTNSGGTVTQVNTGGGLTGGPITTTGTISVNAPVCNTTTHKLHWNSTSQVFECVTDQNTTYTADEQTLTMVGTQLNVRDVFLRNDNDDTTSGTISMRDLVLTPEAEPSTNLQRGRIYYDTTSKKLRFYNGTQWIDLADTTNSSYSAGDGLDMIGNTLAVDLASAGGLQITATELAMDLDGSTLALSANGLRVNEQGITPLQIAVSVAGNGLTGGNGSALSVNAGDGLSITSDQVNINVDNSTVEIASDVLRVRDNGITAIKLNSSVAGNGLVLSSSDLSVNVDGSTIQITGDTLSVTNNVTRVTDIDTEAELETQLVDVSIVWTNNDGNLNDDDLSNNTTTDLPEGTINKYFTNNRAIDAFGNTLLDTSEVDFNFNNSTHQITATIFDSSLNESRLNISNTPTSGNFLGYNTSNQMQWLNNSGSFSLGDMTDVNTTTLTNGNILMTDGTDWESVSQTNITKLGIITTGTWNGSPITDNYIQSLGGGVRGDILYHNGTNWTRLAAGTSGQYLQTQGAAANPAWANRPNITGTVQGSILSWDNATNSWRENTNVIANATNGNLTIKGLLITGSTGVQLTTADGRLQGINSTYFSNLSGADLTTLNASAISLGNLNSARMPVGGDWVLTSNLDIGTNGLVVNPTTNRVGIGSSTLTEGLNIDGALVLGTDINNGVETAPEGGVGTMRYRDGRLEGFDGTKWQLLGDRWKMATGNDLFRDTGNVGIGTSANPEAKLTVEGGGIEQKFNNSSLKEVGWLGSLNNIREVFVLGKFAYVTYGNSLGIIDISNPKQPTLTGSITNTNLSGAQGLFVVGSYAYIAAPNVNRLTVIDISNSSSPTEKVSFTDTSLTTVRNLHVIDGKVYAVGDWGFSIINVDNISSPSVYYSFDTSDVLSDIYVQGQYAYISGTSAMHIWDLTTNTQVSTPTGLNNYKDIYVSGAKLYSVSNSGLEVMNVSNPTSVTVSGVLTGGRLANTKGIINSNRYAYVVSDTNNSLSVINVQTPASMTEVAYLVDGATTHFSGVRDIDISGKYAFLASGTENGLAIIDLSGLDAPGANIGDLATSSIDIWDNTKIANNLIVGTGLNVGSGANIQGETAVGGTLKQGTINGSGSVNLCILNGNLAQCSSSAKYKENIEALNLGLDVINQLKPRYFTWKETGQKDFGFVAEEVDQVSSLLTTKNDNGQIEGVRYNNLTAVLSNAVKEQQLQIDGLQTTVDNFSFQPQNDEIIKILENNTLNKITVNTLLVKENATFDQDIEVKGHLTLGQDSVGEATVAVGETKVRVNFTKEYSGEPIVTISFNEYIDGSYRVTGKDNKGFTIELEKAQVLPVKFDWHAFIGKSTSISVGP